MQLQILCIFSCQLVRFLDFRMMRFIFKILALVNFCCNMNCLCVLMLKLKQSGVYFIGIHGSKQCNLNITLNACLLQAAFDAMRCIIVICQSTFIVWAKIGKRKKVDWSHGRNSWNTVLPRLERPRNIKLTRLSLLVQTKGTYYLRGRAFFQCLI